MLLKEDENHESRKDINPHRERDRRSERDRHSKEETLLGEQ